MTVAPPETLFDDILKFLATSPSAAQIVAYQPTPVLRQSLSELLHKNRAGQLTNTEQRELEEFIRMNVQEGYSSESHVLLSLRTAQRLCQHDVVLRWASTLFTPESTAHAIAPLDAQLRWRLLRV